MSVTITYQPHPDIETVESYIIFIKKDETTPAESFAVEDWTEDGTVGDPTTLSYTDADGNENYLYAVQTVGDGGKKSPIGHLIPGHDRSTFARMISGAGFLSHFAPGAIDDAELWHEEREATTYIVDEVLRARFNTRQIFGFYGSPLPAMRQMVALWAAMSLTVKHRPHDDDQWKKMQERYDAILSGFASKKAALDQDLQTVDEQGPGEAAVGWDWER